MIYTNCYFHISVVLKSFETTPACIPCLRDTAALSVVQLLLLSPLGISVIVLDPVPVQDCIMYTVKKVTRVSNFPSPAGMSLTKLSLAGNN
jgi:hypothetical protein